MNLFTEEQVMSPNGREELNPGVLQWSINSQPPTPRQGNTGGEPMPLQTDYEQAFDSVCCQCGEMMVLNEV
eukprot:2025243-Amphidinium_carterae.1